MNGQIAEQLRTTREAVRHHLRCLDERATLTNSPGVDYMVAFRRCQRAFGLPVGESRMWTTCENAVLFRLHALIVEFGGGG